MENKHNILENPLENAPFLSKIEKKNNFSTPKNYFESRVEIITHKELDNNKLKFIFDKLSYRFLVPISGFTAIIIALFYFNTSTPTTPLTSEQISDVLINESYIEMDEDMLIETYSELLENETITEESNENEEEEYINYLIENDIDITTIINEL